MTDPGDSATLSELASSVADPKLYIYIFYFIFTIDAPMWTNLNQSLTLVGLSPVVDRLGGVSPDGGEGFELPDSVGDRVILNVAWSHACCSGVNSGVSRSSIWIVQRVLAIELDLR